MINYLDSRCEQAHQLDALALKRLHARMLSIREKSKHHLLTLR
jgi:hypothetical protein